MLSPFKLNSADILAIGIQVQKAPRVGLCTSGGARFAPPLKYTYGLLTLGKNGHDVGITAHDFDPDPFNFEECLDGFTWLELDLTAYGEAKMMNQDEAVSGVNGRLRPRKTTVSDLQFSNKILRRSDDKTIDDKAKKGVKPSQKQNETIFVPNLPSTHFLCPYCDKRFTLKQSLSKHIKRSHFYPLENDISVITCQFCDHSEENAFDILKHMIDKHGNIYFACFDCKIRFSTSSELAEHKTSVCKKRKSQSYRDKLRQRCNPSISRNVSTENEESFLDSKEDIFPDGFKSIVISCELKPTEAQDTTDIENNITANVILPQCKNVGNKGVLDKNTVLLLDNIQWNNKISPSFSFRNNDTDQILSRLGVVHRSPRTGESTQRDWYRNIEDVSKFEKCFDSTFYSKVSRNVNENLSKFLDGTLNRFNCDDIVVKTRKSKGIVNINTIEGFPILLAPEQYSRVVFEGYMPRMITSKHKFKWDGNENDRLPLSVQSRIGSHTDPHVNECIITLVSRLDIGTQLCMRRKFETKFNSCLNSKKVDSVGIELKEILESREIPTSSQFVVNVTKPIEYENVNNFPNCLGLIPSTKKYHMEPSVLSGEWARPRRYVCCACGDQTENPKTLSLHISNQHPNAQVSHYEIVGEPLLNADILKHLYVPPSHSGNRSRPVRGSKECTKCKKPITLEDFHQHMLECAGDTPIARRKCRYRPFGVRRRRPRLPDNRIRKQIRKELRNRQSHQKKRRPRPRPRIRTEVGDGETIRKMLADLPAKRHRVAINPINTILRPRRKLEKPRNKICLRRRIPEVPKKKLRNADAIDFDTKSENNDDKPIIKCKQMFLKTKSSRVRRNTSIKAKPVPLKKVTRSSNRQYPIIGTETVLATRNEPLNSSNSDSESVKNIDKLSLNNDSNRININNVSPNKKECSTQHGSNYRDSRNPSCNDQNKGDLSKKSTPQKVPLKHSIERLTANTDTNDRPHRFQHNYLMNHQFIQSFTQNAHNLHGGHQPLFENEAVVIKLDKPPLCDMYPQNDPYPSQKCNTAAIKNKSRKGLNDCIAMLKNKLDPVPGTSSSREDAVPESTVHVQKTEENPVNVSRTNFEQPMQVNNILPAHITTSQCAMTPLDLSGKSQRLVNENNYTEEATNLCTKDNAPGSLSEPKEMYVTLDLSKKGTKSQVHGELALISKRTSLQDSNDQYNCFIKHEETTLDLSMKSSTAVNKCANAILDLTSKTATPGNEYLDLTARQIVSDSIAHTKIATVPKKSADRIPQNKTRASGSTDVEKDPIKSDNEVCNVDILPKEIVEMLYTMPVQHRNTLLNVLPQVLAKTVKELKLVADPSTSTELITSSNKSEIATQTSSISLESMCPPEFLNIDTNKFLIDPCTGALTERTQPEDIDTQPSHLEKVIDLTLDERVSNANLNKVLQNSNLINPIGIDAVHKMSKEQTVIKPKGSSEQTASLRAVRIKSSTDKSKIFKVENNVLFNTTVSHERKCNFNEISDKNVAGLSIANTTLAIQQAEISSTQQNSCQKKQSTVTSTNEPKNDFNNKSPVNINDTLKNISAKIDAGIQDHNTVLHSTIITAANTNNKNETDILPDVKIFTNVNADDINDPTENVSDSNLKHNLDCEIPQKIVKSKTIEQELSETTNIQSSSLKSPIQISKEITENLKIPILSTQLDDSDTDDDEEDNISLAVIVKQKQMKNMSPLKSPSMKSVVDSQSSESSTLLHREDKLRRINKYKKPNKPTLVLAVCQAVEEINDTFAEHISNTNDDKKIASPPKVQLFRPVESIDVNVCLCGRKSHLRCKSQKNTKENNSDVKKNESAEINNVSGKACKPDHKKSFASEESKKMEHDNYLQCENKDESSNINVGLEILDNDKPELQMEKNTNKTAKKCLKSFKSSPNNEQKERVTATFENEQLSIDRSTVKNVSCETPPLRRSSRRGKSSNTDNEAVNKPETAVVVENKTPLTKKQLIFSKLLLDAEKFTKLSQIKSIASDNIPKQSNTDADNDHNLIQNVIESTAGNCQDDLNISSKGQKSNSPLKTKSKQKTSVNVKQDESHNSDLNDEQEAKKKQQFLKTNVDQPCMEHIIDSNEQQELIQEAKKKQSHNIVLDVGKPCIPLRNNFEYPPVTETVTSTYYQSSPVQGSSKDPDFMPGFETYRMPHLSVTIDSNHTITEKDLHHNNEQTFENRLPKRKSSSHLQTENISKPKKVKINESQSVIVNNEEDTTFASTFDDYLDEYHQRTSIYKSTRRKTRSQPADVQIPSSSNIFHGKFDDTSDRNQDSVFQISHKPHTYTSSQYSTGNFNMNFNVAPGRDNPDIHDDNAVNGNDNDDYSDDSSRCDEPLRKLVGEISKNTSQANDSLISACEKDDDNDINNRRTLTMCNNVEKTSDEAAEVELKSEQFMESFGFFSERKPRKSNLIAAKKISETFNIIANENDDVYLSNKERSTKMPSEDKSQNENRIKMPVTCLDDDSTSSSSQASSSRKSTKKTLKKKEHNPGRPYCDICCKEFRRWDNLYRHKQLSLLHIAKLSQLEKRFNTMPYTEGPNYLVIYKKRLERLKKLTDQLNNERMAKGETASLNNPILPTFEDIMADMSKLTSEGAKNAARRGLSCDEELFLDCCELLKESHKTENPNATTASTSDAVVNEQFMVKPFDTSTHEVFSQLSDDFERIDNKSEGDVDSLTAKTILESEEVRNLENDLISGLKEAVGMPNSHHVMMPSLNISKKPSESLVVTTEIRSNPPPLPLDLPEPKPVKDKAKEKNIFTEVDVIDIFEDKFDKIKRKCRSQAAAAKQVQQNVETKHSSTRKKKKSEKRSKAKKGSKKSLPGTVLTKGALKGFDGIKVSIPTSEINLPSIVPSGSEHSTKKRKKHYNKKRKEKVSPDFHPPPSYIDDQTIKDIKKSPPKQVDVYEFMDNEETDMLDFRTSSLHRFKSPNKDIPSTSKPPFTAFKETEESQLSSSTASDGDDFVYMSDHYLCSGDESENSVTSFEHGSTNRAIIDTKKSMSNLKRKEVIENNAAMEKIFKSDVVRNNDKNNTTHTDESNNDKANLDLLFDSLLENQPGSSMLTKEIALPKKDDNITIINNDLIDVSDIEAGVAQRRARRKCTVGKQNILAETWSSESEPEIGSIGRPNSTESVVVGRKKKSKRSNRHITFKTDNNESRVSSGNSKSARRHKRSRSETAHNWSSADEDEKSKGEPPALVEQHGWIVGDSHKKLVTMLAHAKGRKRDDKRTFIE